MKSSKPEELLALGESWSPLSEENGRPAEYTSCAARRPFGADPAPGFVVRSHGKIGYVMLPKPLSDLTIVIVEDHDDTRKSIGSLISALFLIDTAKTELEEVFSIKFDPLVRMDCDVS